MLANQKVVIRAIMHFTPGDDQAKVHAIFNKIEDPSHDSRQVWIDFCATMQTNIKEHMGIPHGECVTGGVVRGIIIGLYMAKFADQPWFAALIDQMDTQYKQLKGENVVGLFGSGAPL